jgi:hypothetical protein
MKGVALVANMVQSDLMRKEWREGDVRDQRFMAPPFYTFALLFLGHRGKGEWPILQQLFG